MGVSYTNIYVIFVVLLAILYVFNLLFFNPVSILFKVGLSFKQYTDQRKKSKDVQNERIKQYIKNSENQDIEAEN